MIDVDLDVCKYSRRVKKKRTEKLPWTSTSVHLPRNYFISYVVRNSSIRIYVSEVTVVAKLFIFAKPFDLRMGI